MRDGWKRWRLKGEDGGERYHAGDLNGESGGRRKELNCYLNGQA